MEKLIIGCDADGVLVDMSSFNIREGRRFFKKEPVDPDAYNPRDIFGSSKYKEYLFGLNVYDKYCRTEQPMEKCSIVLNEAKMSGDELHSITARKFTTSKTVIGRRYRRLYEKWLKEHKITFDSIQYCSERNTAEEKLMACRKLDVDVMLEDKPEVALHLAENGIKVILVDAPYNRELEHENITRAYNWTEIRKILIKMRASKKKAQPFVKLSKEEKETMTSEEKEKYRDSYRNYIKNLKFNKTMFEENKKIYKRLYTLTKIPFDILFNCKIEGKENIPYQNGFIVASNHLYNYDQFYISRALGNRDFCGFAASTIENTARGKLFAMTKGVVFIDREDSKSKEHGKEEIMQRVMNGQTAVIFPEGTRKNKDEEGKKKLLNPLKTGVAEIAWITGAPYIVVILHKEKGKWHLKISEPEYVKAGDDIVEVTKKIEEKMKSMLIEAQEEGCKVKKYSR